MRNRVCIALVVAAANTILLTSPAMAQDKDAVTEMARRRFQEGVKFFDQKRFEEARGAFLQAYALKHHPAVLLNLAQSEIRSGHPLEGARHFSAFLHDSSTPSGAERSDAEKGLATARTKLGRIQILVNAGAEILVDGEVVGQSPLPEPVDAAPGNHNVEARLAGHSATASVSVTIGKSTSTILTLDSSTGVASAPTPAPVSPEAPPPPPEASEPPDLSKAPPPAGPDLGAPIASEGREPFFSWLTHSTVGILGLGVTAVGLGVGVGFAVAGSKASDNADSVAGKIEAEGASLAAADGTQPRSDLCSPDQPNYAHYAQHCQVLQDNLDKSDNDRTVAAVGFVAAGVGVVGTVTMYFLTAGKSSSPVQAMVAPVVTAHSSGLAIVGSF